MILAVDFPGVEFIIFAVAILLAIIGKIVEFSKKIRQKSIEAQQQDEKRFGDEWGEAPEPPHVEAPPPRLELQRRPPRPRREEAERPSLPVVRHVPRVRPPEHAEPRHEHPIVAVLREPKGVRNAILLAEVLGPPKALRRWR